MAHDSHISAPQRIFVVDDDLAIRRLLQQHLESAGYAVVSFRSAEEFLDAVGPHSRGCVLLDIDLPGIKGTQVQSLLAERKIKLPVIFISAAADVPTTAAVMKRGAVDVMLKPFVPEEVIRSVEAALQLCSKQQQASNEADDYARLVQLLTPREREVAELVVQGLPNKLMARSLGISDRTIEIHKARVLKKMRCESIAQLVRLWVSAGR